MDPDGVIEVRNRCGIWNVGKIGLVHPIYSFIFFNFQSNWNEIVDNFDDMNLKRSLLRGIYAYGLRKPSIFSRELLFHVLKVKERVDNFLKMS